MEAKHTPGPWEYNTDSRWPNCLIAPKAIPGPLSLSRVCEAHYLSAADAKLIAAAPDLLEALQDCNEQLEIYLQGTDDGMDDDAESAYQFACAAIEKATQ